MKRVCSGESSLIFLTLFTDCVSEKGVESKKLRNFNGSNWHSSMKVNISLTSALYYQDNMNFLISPICMSEDLDTLLSFSY